MINSTDFLVDQVRVHQGAGQSFKLMIKTEVFLEPAVSMRLEGVLI